MLTHDEDFLARSHHNGGEQLQAGWLCFINHGLSFPILLRDGPTVIKSYGGTFLNCINCYYVHVMLPQLSIHWRLSKFYN